MADAGRSAEGFPQAANGAPCTALSRWERAPRFSRGG